MTNTTTILTAVSAVVVGYVVWTRLRHPGGRNNPKNLPLPPGPPGLPLIGNAHQILGKNMLTVFNEWAKEYGPVVYIRLFGQPVIVLSSVEAANDLLEDRHKNYSGRPNSILASTAMQGDMMMPFIHANERFTRVRKLVVTEMRPTAVAEYFNPVQTIEVHRLVNLIIQQPNQWQTFVARCMGSILTTVVYDKPLRNDEDSDGLIKHVIRLNDELINAIDSGQNYVDFLPFLQYVPFIPYKKRAAAYYRLAEMTYKALMDQARDNYRAGGPANSIAARLLSDQDSIESDYREQYWALATFYLAGSDTQSIASQSLILALALNPHVLAKAQEEVDRVVGSDRVPAYGDEPELPYIKAMVREVLRWRPTGPTAIPHAAVKDDGYNGHFIPGGSMVIPNIWTMQMNPKVYDKPEVFDPQRYIDNPSLPLHAFGFGRRNCPGKRVAEHTLFLEFATIAWALNITVATDPDTGNPIPLDSDRETGYSPVGLLRPKPFKVSITPRSPQRAKLLSQIVESEEP